MNRRTLIVALTALMALPAALACADEPKGQQDKDLEGEWELKALTENGVERAEGAGAVKVLLTIRDGVIAVKEGDATHKAAYKADAGKTPRTIDMTPQDGDDKGKTVLAIYEVKGEELRLCHADPDKDRPTEFSSAKGSGWTLAVFRRVKK